MGSFEKAMEHIFKVEGGYSDHASDTGGKTRFGITEAVARKNGYFGTMQYLPQEIAVQIYKKDYWDKLSLNSVPYPLDQKMFDIGVNMGVGVAATFLQRALNSLVGDVKLDGQIGPKTLAVLDAFIAKRGGTGIDVLTKTINSLQCVRYLEIAERNPTQRVFLYGWIRARVD